MDFALRQGDQYLKVVGALLIGILSLQATIGEAESDSIINATVDERRLLGEIELKSKLDQSKHTQAIAMGDKVQSVNIQEDPFSQVEKVTIELIEVIKIYKETYPTNEIAFFSAIREVLRPHVDFSYMAKIVMGSYRKIATNEQRDLFAKVFRDGLIETYSRGLLSFNNQQIALVNRAPLKKGQRKVYVKQEIHAVDKTYPLSYTMRKKKTGEWMITNVTINGINLGKTLQNQFHKAAQKNSNDIDYVIASWANQVI